MFFLGLNAKQDFVDEIDFLKSTILSNQIKVNPFFLVYVNFLTIQISLANIIHQINHAKYAHKRGMSPRIRRYPYIPDIVFS